MNSFFYFIIVERNKCFKYVTVSFIQHFELFNSMFTPHIQVIFFNKIFSDVVGHNIFVFHDGKWTLIPETWGLGAEVSDGEA